MLTGELMQMESIQLLLTKLWITVMHLEHKNQGEKRVMPII
jgi:hypothetical protein